MTRKEMQEKQVVAYLPTTVDLDRWKSLAKIKGCSMSRFIYEMVELALEHEKPVQMVQPSVPDEKDVLHKEISELRTEVEQLLKQNDHLKETLTSISTPVVERYKKETVKLLQEIFSMDSQKLTEKLQERAEQEKVQINKALRELIDEGKVEETRKGVLKWKKNTKV